MEVLPARPVDTGVGEEGDGRQHGQNHWQQSRHQRHRQLWCVAAERGEGGRVRGRREGVGKEGG